MRLPVYFIGAGGDGASSNGESSPFLSVAPLEPLERDGIGDGKSDGDVDGVCNTRSDELPVGGVLVEGIVDGTGAASAGADGEGTNIGDGSGVNVEGAVCGAVAGVCEDGAGPGAESAGGVAGPGTIGSFSLFGWFGVSPESCGTLCGGGKSS